MVFDRYSKFYDLLYEEKDYHAECDFLEDLLQTYASKPVESILDLGCGTGGHAIPLAQRGYNVTGVDLSEKMISIAREKATQAGVDIRFHQGDIRHLDLGVKFDAVIAMFAVMSYQTTNDDLLAALKATRRHLHTDGVFTFDSWFGPAVLTIQPKDRVKKSQQENLTVIRIAKPSLDLVNNSVRVNYTLLHIQDDQLLEEVNESHLVRFLFQPEVELLCRMTDFEMVKACPFIQLDRQLSDLDWNASWTVRAL